MTVKRSAFARDFEGSTGDFYNDETILYDGGIWILVLIPWSKPIEHTAARGKPNANYGL